MKYLQYIDADSTEHSTYWVSERILGTIVHQPHDGVTFNKFSTATLLKLCQSSSKNIRGFVLTADIYLYKTCINRIEKPISMSHTTVLILLKEFTVHARRTSHRFPCQARYIPKLFQETFPFLAYSLLFLHCLQSCPQVFAPSHTLQLLYT